MNGDQHHIAAAGYEAEICGVGGALRTLVHDGRDLVVGFAQEELRPLYRGVVAAPWPNRIADGRYHYDGATHQLPVNELDRMTALHGLALWETWRVVDRAADRVVLAYRVNARTGYPFILDLEVTYALDEDGLAVTLRATNAGRDAAPYGCTIHPYLRAGDGPVDGWTLELPAAAYLDVDERLLPTEVRAVDGTPFDFRSARRIGTTALDHAFTRLDVADEARRVRLRDEAGGGVELSWGDGLPWVQIFTSDQHGGPHHRTGVAVEPMTCPPDAFRSGTDLVILPSGGSHEARWGIRALIG